MNFGSTSSTADFRDSAAGFSSDDTVPSLISDNTGDSDFDSDLEKNLDDFENLECNASDLPDLDDDAALAVDDFDNLECNANNLSNLDDDGALAVVGAVPARDPQRALQATEIMRKDFRVADLPASEATPEALQDTTSPAFGEATNEGVQNAASPTLDEGAIREFQDALDILLESRFARGGET